ncbi:hypothetical protein CERSUDRAFT_111141 [Gelatoporia subvermispora B]|uniref:Uncharacterized protein n=1 Tax=Ceriporiopsis subvermispora (strain B) TaxID=914234 RepID=M2RNW9_CERS8|nr:hypothetical protein CERSUDRAFT_111141 [Gelatoporia subvermispora B]
MATPPTRKRHTCHKCGSPMAGHKRPNRGPPVCPTPRGGSPSDDITPRATPSLFERIQGPHRNVTPTLLSRMEGPSRMPIPSPLRRRDAVSHIGPIGRHRSPSWAAPEVIHVDDDDDGDYRDTPFSWVTDETYDCETEIADEEYDEEGDHEPEEFDAEEEDDDDNSSQTSKSSSATASTSASVRMTRAFSEMLRDSTPLASFFSTPTNRIPEVTNLAKRGGMHAGVVRNPNRGQHRVRNGQLQRENTHWVVMGSNQEAVEHIVRLDGQDYETRAMVGAYPQDHRIRSTFLDVLVAGAMGGLAVWYALGSIG